MPFDGAEWLSRAELDLRILRAARVALARSGAWHQGTLGEPGVSMCVIGWIHHIGWNVGERDYETLGRRLLWPALPWRWRLVDRFWTLASFNDAPWRRQRRMVRLLSRAIRLAEQRAGLR
jgi:hypothetical protein